MPQRVNNNNNSSIYWHYPGIAECSMYTGNLDGGILKKVDTGVCYINSMTKF